MWKLIVNDATLNMTAVKLVRWSLRIYGEELGVDNTYIYTDEYNAIITSNKQRSVLGAQSIGRNTINTAAINGNVSINMLIGRAMLNGVGLNIRDPSLIQNLISGDGNDVLIASNEKSVLYAGRAINSLTGGSSSDIFVIMAGKGRSISDSDTIYGFNVAQGDRILIVGLKCKKFNDLFVQQINNNRDVKISWSPSNQSQNILVKNVFVNELNSQNVIIQQMLKLPTSYIKSGSLDNSFVSEDTAVIKLNRSIGSTYIELWGSNWALKGVIFRRQPSNINRFVVQPIQNFAQNFGAAVVQGYMAGIDKIDLSLLGVKRFDQVTLAKKDWASVNEVAIISGTDIKLHSSSNLDNNKMENLVYLDAIDPSQLTERDFIFTDSPYAVEGIDLNCVNTCQPNPCNNNGTCSQLNSYSDEFLCTCAPGYIGDRCQNLKEMCSPTNPCKNDALCSQNGPNKFKCSCRKGTYGELCQNVINSCLNYTCQNNGSCVQIKPEDEPKCLCRYGFEGPRCEIVTSMCEPNNPCANKGKCNQTAPGIFVCVCLTGFYGTYCEKINNICNAIKPCLKEEVCVQIDENTFECRCPKGYEGERCESIAIETVTTTTTRPTTTTARPTTTTARPTTTTTRPTTTTPGPTTTTARPTTTTARPTTTRPKPTTTTARPTTTRPRPTTTTARPTTTTPGRSTTTTRPTTTTPGPTTTTPGPTNTTPRPTTTTPGPTTSIAANFELLLGTLKSKLEAYVC